VVSPLQLESRIKGLRNSLRRLLALHGLSWVVGSVVPLVILAGLADWLFHIDFVIRAALLAVLAGAALWLAYERIVRPLIVRFDDLDIALRIEERWPGLNDRLASTIQFLRMDARDERLGSPALRAATVRKAVEETSAIDFREVIELRPVIRGLLAASSALLIATLLVMLAPGTVRIAMKRLFLPLSGTTWPQRTHLVLDDGQTTLKVARGDSFTLSVKVRPGDKVPDSARATYEFADGDRASEPLRSVEGGEFRGRIESVNQPFHFTVTAGDDSSSIRDVPVKVVPPPTLKSLVVRLVSPAYTGIPPQVLAPGLTQLRALEGTKLQLEAIANKPLARAVLNVGEAPVGGDLKFDGARTGFRAELTVKNNFNFWFDLVDAEGFRNRDAVRYEVRGFSDLAPRVVIDEPKSDRDVPAEATIPVRLVLDDDFGLQSGKMIYRLATGDSEPHEAVDIPLWTAPRPGPGPAVGSFVKHQEVAHDWQLAPGARFRYDRRAQPRQEPRDPAADHFKRGSSPPARRQPPRAARRAGPRAHHAKAGDHSRRQRDPQPEGNHEAAAAAARRFEQRRDDPAAGGKPAEQPRRRGRGPPPPVARGPGEFQARQPRSAAADGGHARSAGGDSRPAPGPRRARNLPRGQESRPGRDQIAGESARSREGWNTGHTT
jgi:hypothetical protein